ncbi:PH domain-containing protein [Aeromicrobium choanae]|uniref:PH domain-containing protein n=1 Tax=Aeromicrobium choanae TaxID=1736691 RepID=A0A1T4Z5K1_9ACTN|nr:PH domain-containing protein [Aeromicrobium choanae]SKB09279.1 PH domain-containing protein [Aeromicrobium choanae]
MTERPAIETAPPPVTARFWRRLREPFPDPENHVALNTRLNPRSGERVLQIVPKHVAVYWTLPAAALASMGCLVVLLFHWNSGPAQALWLLSLVVTVAAAVRAFVEWRDVFVVTNWRVVRLSGVLTARVATMPINRILDMTMTRSVWGRALGYGHFVFESAAQEQGLREIKFVPDILAVDREINNAVNRENRRRERMMAATRDRTLDGGPDEGERTEPIRGL